MSRISAIITSRSNDEYRLSFSPGVTVHSLTTVNQQKTPTSILSPSANGRPGPTCQECDSNTTSWVITCVLSLGLHCSLQNWKRPISGNGISLYSHTQLSTFSNPAYLYKIIGLQRYRSSMLSWKSMRKSWSHVFCLQWVMIALTAWGSLHCIKTFWRTLISYIERRK